VMWSNSPLARLSDCSLTTGTWKQAHGAWPIAFDNLRLTGKDQQKWQ
jgi:hypothetical protein